MSLIYPHSGCELCGRTPPEPALWLYRTVDGVESGPLCSLNCAEAWPPGSDKTPPANAQALIDELAPRVSEVVARLRTIGQASARVPFRAEYYNIIDELAQVATILTLASAISDVSEDHWRSRRASNDGGVG